VGVSVGEMIGLLAAAVVGTVIGAVVSLVPALHVYNVAALLLPASAALGDLVPPEPVAFLFVGMTAGYAMSNAVSGIFFSAPDDSTIFVVLPGQKYILQKRGYEAVMLTGIGGLGGIAALAALTPVSSSLFPALRDILQPHLHWILWCIIAYMLLSEWPKGSGRAPAGLRRWWDGWRSLAAGLITFLLSGMLGFILLARCLVPVTVAYQNLLPAFMGLFAVPWIL
jgi:putative membrane protein